MKNHDPTKANLRYGTLKKSLLGYCKENFEDLFVTPEKEIKKENETEADRLDREIRLRHKKFGNIEFVGELFKFGLVTESILYSIFESLLGIGCYTVTEVTIDAALKLINKLGSKLEKDTNTKKDGPKK